MDQVGNLANQLVQSPQQLTTSLDNSMAMRGEATKYSKLLLGCYRTGEANDPQVYAAAVAATLSHFPVEIMMRVCDPRGGLPSKVKWLPSVQEIHTACELLVEEDRLKWKRQRDLAEQMAARPEMDEIYERHRITVVDPCNLRIAAGRRGFEQMVKAHTDGRTKHLRYEANGSIWVSYGEYASIVGILSRGR